jgi:hypothetical protein
MMPEVKDKLTVNQEDTVLALRCETPEWGIHRKGQGTYECRDNGKRLPGHYVRRSAHQKNATKG